MFRPIHCSIEDVERGEERRRAVALVVVGHRAGEALLQGQARLRAVERLDLAPLVEREHDRGRGEDRRRCRRRPRAWRQSIGRELDTLATRIRAEHLGH